MRRAADGIPKLLSGLSNRYSSSTPSPPLTVRLGRLIASQIAELHICFKPVAHGSSGEVLPCGYPVRFSSSTPGEGESEPVKSKYLEREGMIRETQKAVRQMYKEGMYKDALEVTQRLVDQVDDHFGRSHGVYASALNDQALMLKSMGRYNEAADSYMKALEVYRIAYKGEENASFAGALHNLGMTFRSMAEQASTLEKLPLLERTKESFERVVQIREKIMPNNHPDLQLARSRLAMVEGLLGGEKERTEARLRAALDGLIVAVGEENASTATAMTNLAVYLKGEGKLDEAKELYETALYARRKIFGESHVDVIVSMYNLAELHRAAGREEEALKIQDEIVEIGERTAAAMGAERGDADEGAGTGVAKEAEKAREDAGREGKASQPNDEESHSTTWTPRKSKKQ